MFPFDPDEPRRHHYEFGHWVLRFLAERNTAEILHLAARDELAHALKRIWVGLGERLPVDDRISPDGLAVRSWRHRHLAIVVVTLPPARYVTEAYFAALVVDGESLQRYIVLERSFDGCVLGEWTPDAHLNLGPGPVPDEEAFIAAVEARLAA